MTAILYFKSIKQPQSTITTIETPFWKKPWFKRSVVFLCCFIGLLIWCYSPPEKSDSQERQEALKKIYENPKKCVLDFHRFKKQYDQVAPTMTWEDDFLFMPSFEELSELTNEQLLQLFKRAQKIGNNFISDLIRAILVARILVDESYGQYDYCELFPPGSYLAVVTLTSIGFEVNIVQSNEFIRSSERPDQPDAVHVGSVGIIVEKSCGDTKVSTDANFNQNFKGMTGIIVREIVSDYLDDVGFRAVGRPLGPTRTFPELPVPSLN